MNIYLDIDGVIVGNASSLEDRIRFLEYLLENCGGSVYWLTTHCSRGINRTREALSGTYSPEFVERICGSFRPTDWGSLAKTDGIDFSKPFVWFDDNLFQYEKAELVRHGALDNFFLVNPKDPEGIKWALEYIKSITD